MKARPSHVPTPHFSPPIHPPKLFLRFETLTSQSFVPAPEDGCLPLSLLLSVITTNSSTIVTKPYFADWTQCFWFCGFRVFLSSHFPGTVWMGGKFHNSVGYKLYSSFSSVSLPGVYNITTARDLSLPQAARASSAVTWPFWCQRGTSILYHSPALTWVQNPQWLMIYCNSPYYEWYWGAVSFNKLLLIVFPEDEWKQPKMGHFPCTVVMSPPVFWRICLQWEMISVWLDGKCPSSLYCVSPSGSLPVSQSCVEITEDTSKILQKK